MKATVTVLCTPGIAHGFRLAGLVPRTVQTGAEATTYLLTLARRAEPAVVLVEEPLHAELPEAARKLLDRTPLPVVVPFPAPAWVEGPPAEEAVVRILRRAVGYRVKL